MSKLEDNTFLLMTLLGLVLLLYVLGQWLFPSRFIKVPTYLVFAGKVVNSATDEWPNNRLVLLYLRGQEAGRSVTQLDEFRDSKEGLHDGLFVIKAENTYGLRERAFKIDNDQGLVFRRAKNLDVLPANYIYHWFGDIEEGSVFNLPVPSKNIEYVLKVVEGDVANLPPELLVSGSTQLKGNNQIVVSLQDELPDEAQPSQSDDTMIKDVKYDASPEIIELSKMTIPMDNCGGSAPLAQDYTYSQTFIHEYRMEASGGVGAQIPIPIEWLGLRVELQAKYGFEQGQIDSREIAYHMQAEPGTNQVYIVTWREVWESGTAQALAGNDIITVPFRVKTNLIYEVDSTKLECGPVVPVESSS